MSARGRIGDRQKAQYAAAGMVSVTDAAAMMGVSKWTIRRYVQAGLLTHTKLGGRIVLPKQAVLDYLAAQTRLGRIA